MRTKDQITSHQAEIISLQNKITEYQQNLGQLLAHPTDDKIEDDQKLDALRKDIQSAQVQVDEHQLAASILEKDMVKEKSRDKEIAKVLKQQKALVPKLLELSTLLVEQLEIAVSTNSRLKDLQKEYAILQKETGEELLPMKFAGASSDYLNIAYSVLSRELREGSRPGRLVQVSLRV